MVDHEIECLWSLVSFLVHLFNVIRKAIFNLLACQKATLVLESGCKILEDVKMVDVDHVKVVKCPRKRPTMILIPEVCVGSQFLCDADLREKKDLEIEGSGYCVIAREGKRSFQMEDGYGVITNINGNSKEAFFGVFDGHGGRAAVDFVSENLGKNIIKAVSELEEGGEGNVELAIRSGYLTTDTEFLNQGVSSGACASTVLLKNGELHVSNLGDCRVVMSIRGEACTLTSDHNPKREDERSRIETLGGYVSCHNGRWRVQDSLAITRAIGDANLKQWIISEPESAKIQLTSECEFLIIASDGLWDKVTDQEAVNVVLRHDENLMKSCKELAEISRSRGSRDDTTVMVVDLAKFV